MEGGENLMDYKKKKSIQNKNLEKDKAAIKGQKGGQTTNKGKDMKDLSGEELDSMSDVEE